MKKVYIVGIGPGSKEYLLPLAKKVIRDADVLIGALRLLSLFTPPRYTGAGFKTEKEVIPLEGNYAKVLNYILKNKDKEKIAVLVSGDPGIFSFSHQVTSRLKPSEYEIIPGISSIQLAFARIGESWEDVFIVSLHGRTKRGLINALLNHKKIFLFADRKNNPANIASFLFRKGIRKGKIFVFNNLSLGNEKIIETDIKTLQQSQDEWGELCVMIIKK